MKKTRDLPQGHVGYCARKTWLRDCDLVYGGLWTGDDLQKLFCAQAKGESTNQKHRPKVKDSLELGISKKIDTY